MSLIESVEQQISNMTEDQIAEELKKALEQSAVRKAKQAEYNQREDVREKRAVYSKQYQEKVKADPEKAQAVLEKRKAYNQRPDVKAKRQDYMKTRNARLKMLLAIAKERGIDVDAITAGAEQSQA